MTAKDQLSKERDAAGRRGSEQNFRDDQYHGDRP